MRDPNRIPIILEVLRQAWTLMPDQRLGQLISNAQSAARTFNSSDIFYLEDEYIVEGLKHLVNEKLSKGRTATTPGTDYVYEIRWSDKH
jgi:hypothetical protein